MSIDAIKLVEQAVMGLEKEGEFSDEIALQRNHLIKALADNILVEFGMIYNAHYSETIYFGM